MSSTTRPGDADADVPSPREVWRAGQSEPEVTVRITPAGGDAFTITGTVQSAQKSGAYNRASVCVRVCPDDGLGVVELETERDSAPWEPFRAFRTGERVQFLGTVTGLDIPGVRHGPNARACGVVR